MHVTWVYLTKTETSSWEKPLWIKFFSPRTSINSPRQISIDVGGQRAGVTCTSRARWNYSSNTLHVYMHDYKLSEQIMSQQWNIIGMHKQIVNKSNNNFTFGNIIKSSTSQVTLKMSITTMNVEGCKEAFCIQCMWITDENWIWQ